MERRGAPQNVQNHQENSTKKPSNMVQELVEEEYYVPKRKLYFNGVGSEEDGNPAGGGEDTL